MTTRLSASADVFWQIKRGTGSKQGKREAPTTPHAPPLAPTTGASVAGFGWLGGTNVGRGKGRLVRGGRGLALALLAIPDLFGEKRNEVGARGGGMGEEGALRLPCWLALLAISDPFGGKRNEIEGSQ
ncbi:MAG TPA: hypothetical protein VFU49_12100 [Ktedonobacteraceae bacterium]|nr:hypothetical protein [Ktedonobacteraceae bacterium]